MDNTSDFVPVTFIKTDILPQVRDLEQYIQGGPGQQKWRALLDRLQTAATRPQEVGTQPSG